MKITFEFATQDDCLDRMVPSDLRVLVAQRDRLQARVAELAAVAVSVRDVLLLRSEIDSDGTRCVNLSASKWSSFCDVIDDNNSGAFITRKQAEAVQASRQAASVPEGWRSTIEKAINMASVFDDGGDGAKGVVSLLTRLLASPTKADERE